VTDYYRLNGSYVIVCFLNIAKASDSVSHRDLFQKLVELNFRANMVKLLSHWYSSQIVDVCCKLITISCFYTMNEHIKEVFCPHP